MNQKKHYLSPQLDLLELKEDVILASGIKFSTNGLYEDGWQ